MNILLGIGIIFLLEFFMIQRREKEADYAVLLPIGYCKIMFICTIACIIFAIVILLRFGSEDGRIGIIFLFCMCFLYFLLCSIFTRGKIKIEEDKLTIVPLLRKKQEIKWHEIDAKIDYQHEKIILRFNKKKLMTISPIYIGYKEFLLVLGDKKLLM